MFLLGICAHINARAGKQTNKQGARRKTCTKFVSLPAICSRFNRTNERSLEFNFVSARTTEIFLFFFLLSVARGRVIEFSRPSRKKFFVAPAVIFSN